MRSARFGSVSIAVVALALTAGVAAPAAADTPTRPGTAPETGSGMPMPLGVKPDGGLSLTLGTSEWQGRFGASTETLVDVLFLNARYRIGDLRLTATLPGMRIRSDGAVFTGIDGTPVIVAPLQSTGRRVRRGLGDVTVGANLLVVKQEASGFDLDLSGRVKLPTASDSSGLSTGKTDYSVAAEVSRSFGIVTPNIRLGYRILGDPAAIKLHDGVTASAGAAVQVLGDSFVLASYDFAERASAFVGDAHELSLGLSTPFARRFRLSSYGSLGLSSGAGGFSAGVSLSVALGKLVT